MTEIKDISSNDEFTNPSRSSLIVRVKRKRNVDPSETICIVEDSEPDQKKLLSSNYLAKTIEKLNHNNVTANNNAEVQPQTKINNMAGQKFVILKRINTVDVPSSGDRAKINVDELMTTTVKSNKTQRTEENHHEDTTATSNNAGSKSGGVFFYANKKSVVHSSSLSQKFLVVDMTQIQMNNQKSISTSSTSSNNSSSSVSNNSNNNNNNNNSASKTRVLDPATRRLNGAILIANKSGDFNGVVLAMGTGASINHRTSDETGGITALMAAAKHCNLRMIKRLLAYCVDVLICNANGETALDIARTAVVTPDMIAMKIEVQQWLYRAALKQHKWKQQQSSRSHYSKQAAVEQQACMDENNDVGDLASSTTTTNNDDDEAYVYDIFHATTTSSSHSVASKNNVNSSSDNREQSQPQSLINPTTSTSNTAVITDEDMTMESYSGPVVPVEGLRITEGDGVELVFEYDSDWSALGAGGDDDSDSNAENHPDNDYPEDEESESDEDDGNDSDDYDNENNQLSYNQYHDSNSDDSEDGDDDDDDDDGIDDGFHPRGVDSNRNNKKSKVPVAKTRVPRFHPCNVAANIIKAETAANAIAAGITTSTTQTTAKTINRKHHKAHIINDDDDDDDDDGAAYPDFSFRGGGVGRVLRPHILGDDINGNGYGSTMSGHSRDTAQLQRIWGEEVNDDSDEEEKDDDGKNNHDNNNRQCQSRRIKDMHQRTGMNFASSPREFDVNGLARYGAELEDDADDVAVLHSLLMTENERSRLVAGMAMNDSTYNVGISNNSNATAIVNLKPGLLSSTTTPMNTTTKFNMMTSLTTDKPSLSTVAYDSELDRMSDD